MHVDIERDNRINNNITKNKKKSLMRVLKQIRKLASIDLNKSQISSNLNKVTNLVYRRNQFS